MASNACVEALQERALVQQERNLAAAGSSRIEEIQEIIALRHRRQAETMQMS